MHFGGNICWNVPLICKAVSDRLTMSVLDLNLCLMPTEVTIESNGEDL